MNFRPNPPLVPRLFVPKEWMRGRKCPNLEIEPFLGFRMITRRWILSIMPVIPAVIFHYFLMGQSLSQAASLNPVQSLAALTAADKAELAEALRLKKVIGDQVWPGFSGADIPIILYNDRHEFLMGAENPGDPWEVVEGDDFLGRHYFRRAAKDPQAFAVSIGAHWAGSIGTLDWMNGKIPFKFSPDFHLALILHEVFHAYQADLAPARFAKALAVYKSESRYPYKDKEFADAWNSEGAALSEALRVADDAAARRSIRKFLQIRDARRERAALGPDLVAYESELEWLEGLAKFAEIRFYESTALRAGETPIVSYRPGLPPYLGWDFIRLEKQLGLQQSDLRFYLSGMAQARLLDRLSPAWKAGANLDKIDLEDLLRTVVGLEKKN